MTNMFKTFDINIDSVQIDEQVITRPKYISISQWREFWGEGLEPQEASYVEKLEDEIDGLEQQNQEYSDEIDALENEIRDLEYENASLQDQVSDLEVVISDFESKE